jgi:cellulose synthase/poly-beta-1,6-N-acetylglucosamine synthase-like glycosyltransferase
MRRLARLLVGPAFVAVIAGLGVLSLVPGAVELGPVSPLLVALDTVVLLGVLVLGLGLALLFYVSLLAREDPTALVHDGPAVEAIVPVYRDADVLHRSVEALLEAAYDPLEITVVVEPDDPDSDRRARALAAAHEAVSVLVNVDRAGSKAGALNAALEARDAPVVALFDADQRPHPQLVPHAVAALEDAAVARVRSVPDPAGGVLESMVYYEYLFLYFLPQKLVRVLLGMAFAGTRSVLIERAVFEDVGRFQEGHLAEDLDFTHRVHEADLRVGELLYYPSLEAPAHDWRDWWGQRLRWMRGQVQVSADRLSDPRTLLNVDGLAAAATLVGTLVAGVLLALTVPKLLVAGLDRPIAVGAGLLGVYVIALATRLVDDRSAGLSGVGWGWVLLPLAFSLYGLVIVRVILGYSLGVEGEWYSVEKST